MKTYSSYTTFLKVREPYAVKALMLMLITHMVSLSTLAQTSVSPYLQKASLSNLVHYGIEDGLPSSEVYGFAFDSQGFLWLATDNGLCRFNGEAFEVYTEKDGVPENVILELKTDLNGDIWGITLTNHIFKINAGSQTFTNSNYQKKLNDSIDLRKIYDWCIGDNGEIHLSTWCNSKLVEPLGHRNARFIEIGENYWRETKPESDAIFQFLLHRNSGGTTLGFNQNSPLTRKISHKNTANDLIGIHTGVPFYSYKNHSDFIRFSNMQVNDSLYYVSVNENLLLVNFNSAEILKHIKFLKIITSFTLIKNDLWIGLNDKGGLVKMNIPLGTESRYLKVLHDHTVTQIYPDSSGGVWIGTREAGVLYQPPSCFVSLYPPKMKGQTIDVLHEVENRVFLVSGGVHGLEIEYNKPTWEYATKYESPVSMTDFSCYGEICFSSMIGREYVRQINGDGTIRIIKGTKSPKLKPINEKKIIRYSSVGCAVSDLSTTPARHSKNLDFDTRVFDVCPLSDTSFLLATAKGIYFQFHETRRPFLRNVISEKTRVNAIVSDRSGKIWCATHTKGLIVCNTKGTKSSKFDTKNGLWSSNVTSVVVSDGVCWAGTKNGLYQIKSDFQHSEVTRLGKDDGLPSEEILQLGVYDKSWLIVSTMKGLCAVELENAKPINKTFDLFNLDFRANNKSTSITKALSLSSEENNIQISFGGKHYANKTPLYWHRNLAKDSQWISTQDNKLYFSNLEPEKYHIQISSAPQFIPQKSLEYSFEILKPFVQTIWFAILLVLGISLVGYAIVKTILARAKLNNKLLISQQTGMISQMNPHFIFNTLNSIQYYLTEKGAEKSYEYISNFSRLIRRVLDSSVTGEIRLNNEIQSLKEYLDLEILRFEDKFTVHIELDQAIDQMASSIVIPSMIIQPFLENAIVHGLSPLTKTGRLELSMKKLNDDLVVTIADNGIGRTKAMERTKNASPLFQKKSIAMSNTTNRIKLLNKVRKANIRLKLRNVEPHGTLVEIRIPL